jgi:hypothetical protein
VGDALGVYNPLTVDVRPATPPPDFDLDSALESLRLFTDIASQRLMFSHFGVVDTVGETIDRAGEELRVWVDTVRDAYGSAGDLDHAVAMVRQRVLDRYRPLPENASAEAAEVLEVLSGVQSNVTGIAHWLDRLAAEKHASENA